MSSTADFERSYSYEVHRALRAAPRLGRNEVARDPDADAENFIGVTSLSALRRVIESFHIAVNSNPFQPGARSDIDKLIDHEGEHAEALRRLGIPEEEIGYAFTVKGRRPRLIGNRYEIGAETYITTNPGQLTIEQRLLVTAYPTELSRGDKAVLARHNKTVVDMGAVAIELGKPDLMPRSLLESDSNLSDCS